LLFFYDNIKTEIQCLISNLKHSGKREAVFGKFLNYVLDWDYDKLRGFRALYLSVDEKPFRKLSAFAGVTGETFCRCIPLMAGRAGNLRIVAHTNHEYVSLELIYLL